MKTTKKTTKNEENKQRKAELLLKLKGNKVTIKVNGKTYDIAWLLFLFITKTDSYSLVKKVLKVIDMDKGEKMDENK